MRPELLEAARRWLRDRTDCTAVRDVSLDRATEDSYGGDGLGMEISYTRSDGSNGWYSCSPGEGVELWRALMETE